MTVVYCSECPSLEDILFVGKTPDETCQAAHAKTTLVSHCRQHAGQQQYIAGPSILCPHGGKESRSFPPVMLDRYFENLKLFVSSNSQARKVPGHTFYIAITALVF
jgi:hypothetical protein